MTPEQYLTPKRILPDPGMTLLAVLLVMCAVIFIWWPTDIYLADVSLVAWLMLARDLPPIASTLSVMFIPVLGVFSGAWWLGEVLHWQDWAAVALVMVAIATVLWPARR